MALQPGTNKQVPEHSIMDHFDKQTYLSNQYVYSVGSSEIGSTSETAIILLQNPAVSVSAFPSGYQSLFVNLRKIICLTASETAIIRLYLNPTFSAAGTSETPINMRPASSSVSVSKLSVGPTVSVNGTFIEILTSNPMVEDSATKLLILDPGQTLLITAQTSSSSTLVATELAWFEL